ncbi:filamentous hemagglutinin N-terminal domain-containing protein [Dyella monticola]|uniref:Filamentous hemagglutinin N-terminal domain-containing protein n=2 Tax=Dyella monticola TaxID=1927958 RepID=A0A370WVC7_9GAMM|nr:hemagglutinin repeat-containing protein [Dyella monticola]RDS79967.1 filamentous hemagglutinin N-terminal domain-containing protein [Dyella monticola]
MAKLGNKTLSRRERVAVSGHAPQRLSIVRLRLAPLAAALSLCLCALPSMAQQVPSGATNTTTGVAGNGVPIVNIAAPNSSGVSLNRYNQFNVSQQGVILNNSATTVTTQLSGYILGNSHLVGSGSANVIVNEVTSTSPSSLNGYIEVAGPSAAVVVANPNGLNCNGCGFINTTRATLTTGTPVFGGSGSLAAFRVTGGAIGISGSGFNASNVAQVDVLARAVQVDAAIYAHQLNVVTGVNLINYNGLGMQVLQVQGAKPQLALDVSALGGMYADKITLIGTEAGVGVNSQGVLQAQQGDFTLSSQGQVVLGGATTATGQLSIAGAQGVQSGGTLYAPGTVQIAGGPITLSGVVGSGSGLTIQGSSVQSSALLAAGMQTDGTLSGSSALQISSTGAITATGTNAAAGGMNLAGSSLNLSGSTLLAGGAVALGAAAGDLNASGSSLQAQGAVTLTTAGTFTTGQASWNAAQWNIVANTWNNAGGQVAQTGGAAAAVNVAGAMSNVGGSLISNGSWQIQAGSLDNSQGHITGAGSAGMTVSASSGVTNTGGQLVSNGALALATSGAVSSAGGTIGGLGNVTLNAASVDVSQGGQLISGNGALTVTTPGAVNDNTGLIQAANALALNANSLDTTGGAVKALGSGTLGLTITQSLTNGDNGVIGGNGAVNVQAGTLTTGTGSTLTGNALTVSVVGATTNAGALESNGVLSVTTAGLSNSGNLLGTSGLDLASTGGVTNTGVVQSGGALTITAANQAIGNSGAIAANGTTLLTAASLTNTKGSLVNGDTSGSTITVTLSGALGNEGGTVGGLGDVSLTAASVDNSAGGQLISQNGALNLSASGAINSNAGLVQSANALTIQAQTLDSTGGAIKAIGSDALTLNISQSFTNGANGVVGGNGAVNVQAGSLTTGASSTLSGNALTVNVTGLTTNAGAIQSNGVLNVTTAGLNSSGDVLGTTGVNLTSSGAVTNTGSLQSGGALTIDATHQSLINSGAMASNGTTTVTAASFTNDKGSLVNGDTSGSATNVNVTGALSNEGGTIGGLGDVTINATGIDNSVGGQLISQNGGLALTTSGALNNAGGLIQSTTALSVTAASADNTGGNIKLLDPATLDLTVSGLLNNGAGGLIGSNGGLNLQFGQLDNQGTLSSTSDLSLATSQTFTNAGTLQTGGHLTLSAAGISNQGTLIGVEGVALTSTGTVTNSGSVESGAALSVIAQGQAVSNAGGTLSAAGTTTLTAASLDNTKGSVIDNDASGSATSITVDGSLVNQGGTIGGLGDVSLNASSIDTSAGGQLISQNGALSLGASGAINDGTGLIQATNALTINAGSLDTTGGSVKALGSDTLTLNLTQALTNGANGVIGGNGAVNVQAGSLTMGTGSTLTGSALTATINGTTTNAGTIQSNSALNLTTAGLNNGGTLLGTNGIDLTSTGAVGNTGNVLSGGTLTIKATNQSVSNSGTMSSNGATLLTAASLTNTKGNVINGDSANSATTVTLTGALANEGGTVGGLGDVTLSAASIDNSAGGQLMSQNGAVSLTATAAFNNAGGLLQATTALGVSAGSVDNEGGKVQLTGTGLLTANVSGLYDNSAGGLTGGNGSVTLGAGSLNNTRGELQATSSLAVTSQGALTNSSGSVISNGTLSLSGTIVSNASGEVVSDGTLGVTAASFDNTSGTVINRSTQATTANVSGLLTNTNGALGGDGTLTATLGGLTNAGGSVIGALGLNVTSTSTLSNDSGQLLSGAALTLNANGQSLSNRQGAIQSHGATTITAASLDNTGGSLVDLTSSQLTVNVAQTLTNASGTLGTQGNANVSAGALNNASGQLIAGGNVTLNPGSTLTNTAGTVLAGSVLTIQGSSAVDNTNGGRLVGGEGINASMASLTNTGGSLESGGELSLTTSGWSGDGTLASSGNLILTLPGNLTIASGSNPFAGNGSLTLTLGGSLTNDGTLEAPDGVSVTAANITNASGATIASGNASTSGVTSLNTGGTLTNAGIIEGTTVNVNAGTLNNTGTVLGQSVTINAGTLVNGLDPGSSNLTDGYDQGTLAASNQLNIYSNSLTNIDATILSLGSLTIAGNASGGLASVVDNRSGLITTQNINGTQDNTLTIDASTITNERRVLDVTGGGAPTTSSTNGNLSCTFGSGEAVSCTYSGALPGNVFSLGTFTQSSQTTLSGASGASEIVSGGNLLLNGSAITNNASTIAAGNNLAINGSSNTSSVNNESWEPGSLSQSVTVWWQNATPLPNGWTQVGKCEAGYPGEEGTTFCMATQGVTVQSTTSPGSGLNATIEANQNITISTGSITNQVTVNGSSVNTSGGGLGSGRGTTVEAAGGNGVNASGTLSGSSAGTVNSVTGSSGWNGSGGFSPLGSLDPTGALETGTPVGSPVGVQGQGIFGGIPSYVPPGAVGPTTQVRQIVGTPGNPLPGLALPTSGLFTINTAPGQPYLIETNPLLTNYQNFITGSYLLGQLNWNGAGTLRQIGDGYYELQLVDQQIVDLTGKPYLADNTNSEDQFEQLMNNAVSVAGQFNLTPGIALTASQMADLTQNIVWLVNETVDGQTVLVPVVYLANGGSGQPDGALISGANVSLSASGTLANSGSILASGNATLTADNLLNAAGTISAGQNLNLATTGNLSNLGGTLSAGQDLTAIVGGTLRNDTLLNGLGNDATATLSAGGNLAAVAGQDLQLDGATITGSTVSLGAGQNLVMGAGPQLQSSSFTSIAGGLSWGTQTTTTLTSISGTNINLTAGNDLTGQGAQVSATGTLNAIAGHDIDLGNVTNTATSGFYQVFHNGSSNGSAMDQQVVGSLLSAGNNVNLVAGNDLTLTASTVESTNGAVNLMAGNNLNLNTAQEQHNSLVFTYGHSGGGLSATDSVGVQYDQSSVAIGSVLSGNTVNLLSGANTTLTAAQIVGTNGVTAQAGGNLVLNTGTTTSRDETASDSDHAGFMGGGGFSVMMGERDTSSDTVVQQSTPVGTVLGSTNGAVMLSANQNVHLTDATVLSQTGTTIVGKNVTIDAALGTTTVNQQEQQGVGGIIAGVGGGVANVANQLVLDGQGASKTSDSRLQALYAMQGAQTLFSQGAGNGMNLGGQTGMQALSSAPGKIASGYESGGTQGALSNSGMSLRIGATQSESRSSTTQTEQTAYGSSIGSTNGDVTIAATGGDLNIIGSQISGQNVTLAAAQNLNVMSQAQQSTLQQSTHSGSGSMGVSIGQTNGIFASGSMAESSAQGNGTTYADSTVNAAKTLTLASGGNTTIEGAQLSGQTIQAVVGGNLDLVSQQNTNSYSSHQSQASGSFSYGGGGGSGGGSYNQGQMQSSYSSVGEVTGLSAGSGGFQISVGGNTNLTGAVIASTADPSKNILNTGSLTYSNLQNSANYSASSAGIAGGYSGNGGGIGNSGASVTPSGMAIPQTGSESSTTQAAIAPGTITIGNNPNQDLSGLSRNASLGDQSLGTIFNAQQIQNNQQAGVLAGQVGMTAAGDLEQTMQWGNGSAQAIALHTVVGAATAALGGGNILQGAVGAGASESAIPYLQQYGSTGVLAGTTLIGGLVGGGAGAATAFAGTQYNYLSHPQLVALQNQIKQCNGDEVCIQTAESNAEILSDKQEQQLVSGCNSSGVDCADNYQNDITTAINYVNDPLAAKLGLVVDQTITAQNYVNNQSQWGLVKADNAVSSDGNMMIGIAATGATAGLGAGPGMLVAEGSGAFQTGSLLQIVLASRGGVAATTGAVNLGAQLIQNGGNFSQVNYINVGTSALGGYLGYGGNMAWNGLVGTGVGMVQTEANNLYYNQNSNVLLSGLTNGAATMVGFKLGDVVGSTSNSQPFTSLSPVLWGNLIGNGATEFLNSTVDKINESSQNQEGGSK